MSPSILIRALPLALLLHIGMSSIANDIQVTNVTLANTDLGQGTTSIQFDISWENSWRGGGVINWDAAWVFVKFKQQSGVWQHVQLPASGHVAPVGSQIDLGLLTPGAAHNSTTNPVIGVFLRRDADGSGTFSAEGVQLAWNFAVLGIGLNDITEVQVFAIEMVYVNQGAFAVGSGGGGPNEFPITTINTLNATTTPTGTGSLGGQAGGHPSGSSPSGNSLYPNGFRAFYCMKFELSQQQYVDFLNTLPRIQQNNRTETNLASGITNVTNRFIMSNTPTIDFRNGIRCDATIPATMPITFYCDGNANGIGGEANDGQWVACNWLSWPDLGAYLDWSGLRPMSELEYEKACRGPLLPVAGEFPWGTTTTTSDNYTLTNSLAANERIGTNFSLVQGNALHDGNAVNIFGPVRTGSFAAHPLSNGRLTSGASYYGIMELGGNVREFAVGILSQGIFYTGQHGNGSTDAQGFHENALLWPDNDAGVGIVTRGGHWATTSARMRVSDRLEQFSLGRGLGNGGRGVRTLP